LSAFLPWVADWFREEIGDPTAPQREAWPAIARGEHTVIHSPTGSGKTFAAFLWALNELFAEQGSQPEQSTENRRRRHRARNRGVHTLYISPLKALNYDVERNLDSPLHGIREFARDHAVDVPEVTSAVRTGDTPPSARSSMTRRPPHILITTPESLYLLLTSPVARDMLRTVRTVIVDEIHTVAGSKRGAHLSLSLERLEDLSPGFQRIGLSATQRPLAEIARFLGGQSVSEDGQPQPRPVTVVDVESQKQMSLRVLGMPQRDLSESGDGGVWAGIIPQVLADVQRHNTTLIFCNSRRQAERTADRLNAQLQISMQDAGYDVPSQAPMSPHSSTVFSSGSEEGVFSAHHGSLSDETRHELEQDLKEGVLPALVGTSSLELGIDIGSVDLVVQLQSPRSVTGGLQRVGRSGHSVGETSQGKVYATHNEDLLEAAVIARGMAQGYVEPVRTPQNALDVLAQQIVAMISMDEQPVDHLLRTVRGSYAYHGLERESFAGVLRMLSGKYPRHLFRALRARIHWDETNDVLRALPGSRLLALNNGGAIVDRGAFPVYLGDGETRLGELDEEFTYETHEGDAFLLGSQVWRAVEMRDDRVVAEPAAGALPRMPFWRGEFPWRPYGLSVTLAQFKSELARRLAPHLYSEDDPPDIVKWLREEYLLDEPGARQALNYVRRQVRATGGMASDKLVMVETYRDRVGDPRMIVHSPFGGKVNAPWAIALASVLRERAGVEPELQVSDDGILLRFPESDSPPPVDMVTGMTAAEARERVLDGLVDSAMFGAKFRGNAARALLLPARARGRRTPFYLQRLRAKDLLSVARGFPDFPILLETYRDALEDEMDMPALERVINAIQASEIRVLSYESETPSPVAQALDFAFTRFYMYEWDAPKAERGMQALQLDRSALAALFSDPRFAGMLRPDAVDEVVGEASRTAAGARARSPDELAQILEELGDLTTEEAQARCEGDAEAWLAELEAAGRVRELEARNKDGQELRWVATPRVAEYQDVLLGGGDRGSLRSTLRSLLERSEPMTLAAIKRRYPAAEPEIEVVLDEMADAGEAVRGYFTEGAGERAEPEWTDEHNLALIQQRTLSLMRSEVKPVPPLEHLRETVRMQGGGQRLGDTRMALDRLRGLALPAGDWTSEVMPARVQGFSTRALDELFKSGEYVWVLTSEGGGGAGRVRVFPRSTGRLYLSDSEIASITSGERPTGLPSHAERVLDFLSSEGVAASADLRSAMNGMPLSDLRDALRVLASQGRVTADSWLALAGLLVDLPGEDPGRPRRGQWPEPVVGSRPRNRRGSSRREAARRVREMTATLPPDARWSLTSRYAVLGPELGAAEQAHARASAFLERYAVVSRHALALEGDPWAWGPIASALSLMELRGEARRGYFVEGLPGLQFALPSSVESLRKPAAPDAAEPVVLSARDPALAVDRDIARRVGGDSARLLTFSRRATTHIVLLDGQPVLLAEDGGARITAAREEPAASLVPEGLAAYRDRRMASAGTRGRLTVRSWNGEDVPGSPGDELLSQAGFRRDYE
ncbi:MAG: DEAD/DEAH box helicase, partial [Chloroflexota bacterium]